MLCGLQTKNLKTVTPIFVFSLRARPQCGKDDQSAVMLGSCGNTGSIIETYYGKIINVRDDERKWAKIKYIYVGGE